MLAGNIGLPSSRPQDNLRTSKPQDLRTSRPRGRTALEVFDPFRPVGLEQPRQRSVGEQSTLGLALGAIVGLGVGVPDPLDRGGAIRTRVAKATVDCHLSTKSSPSRAKTTRLPSRETLSTRRPASSSGDGSTVRNTKGLVTRNRSRGEPPTSRFKHST